MKKQKVFIIGGPTASGKSALSVRLAQEIGGSVVNGDAIQVYKDLQVLSARPTKEDMQNIPHLMFGEVDAWTNYSLADWLNRVKEIIPSIQNPIVVGGTGMYLDALMNGVSAIPEIDPEIRERVRQMPLEDVKKQMKGFLFHDPQRLRRGLEVLLSTGKPISYFHELPKTKMVDADFCLIHVLPDREKIYQNCKVRFDLMKQQGAIDEVRYLEKIKATGGVLKAIGVPEIRKYLRGNLTENEMTTLAVTATRQYAKRQMTWFRHHGDPAYIVTDVKSFNIKNITK